MVAIRFDNVTKSYPNYGVVTQGFKNMILTSLQGKTAAFNQTFTALSDISFEIKAGESVGVIGRNGAGKSTLLGLMARVLRPNVGKVEITGRVTPLLELGGGFHPDLSGRENIMLNSVLLGMSRAEAKEKVPAIIEFSELGQFIDRPVRTYSTGMTSRLGFSVAAHLDPDILLVDEVLAVGDHTFQKKCMKVFEDFRKKGVTVVLVSHGQGDIEKVCTRVLWIENHKLRADGKPGEILGQYLEAR